MTDTFAVVSNYNNDVEWLDDYFENYVIYNQGEKLDHPKAVQRPHIGSDIYDKFSWIYDNYHDLPDRAMLIKANLFKYISKDEFDSVHTNHSPTPLLTMHHKTALPISYYGRVGESIMYHELNNSWYVPAFPHKHFASYNEFATMMGLPTPEYLAFAPGSNYILTRDSIQKHPRKFYKQLMSYLDYTSYSAEAQMCERSLFTLWL